VTRGLRSRPIEVTLRRGMNRTLAFLVVLLLGAWSVLARADDGAQTFLEAQHQKVATLLHQAASPARDAQVSAVLDGMIDYGELARRTFGVPCPSAVPGCTHHWTELTDAQKAEVQGLLQKLVSKNYQKNLIKTLDYDISYKGNQDAGGGATRVRTEATSKVNVRDPPVQIDYVIAGGPGSYKVVDIITEGSSLTKNYYDQFRKKMNNPAEGYPNIVEKLKEKIAKKD
jgi:phospholipid transport system substrate-binding protein